MPFALQLHGLPPVLLPASIESTWPLLILWWRRCCLLLWSVTEAQSMQIPLDFVGMKSSRCKTSASDGQKELNRTRVTNVTKDLWILHVRQTCLPLGILLTIFQKKRVLGDWSLSRIADITQVTSLSCDFVGIYCTSRPLRVPDGISRCKTSALWLSYRIHRTLVP